MAGIVSATPAQLEALRKAMIPALAQVQRFVQSSLQPTKLNATEITETDALIDALAAALAPVNT